MNDTDGTPGEALRARFMAWQCLIRHFAMRRGGGRPTEGMAPLVTADDGEALGHVRTVIVERRPEASTALLRHAARATRDLRERRERGLAHLSSRYFQNPARFEPRLFALFAPSSRGAVRLAGDGRCTLDFRQSGQAFRLPCRVAGLGAEDPFAQALLAHNALFNPALPPGCIALAFEPQWTHGTASQETGEQGPGPGRAGRAHATG